MTICWRTLDKETNNIYQDSFHLPRQKYKAWPITRTIKVSCLSRFLPGDVHASRAITASALWARTFFLLLTFYLYESRLAIKILYENYTRTSLQWSQFKFCTLTKMLFRPTLHRDTAPLPIYNIGYRDYFTSVNINCTATAPATD
jgi:hypothetical protein